MWNDETIKLIKEHFVAVAVPTWTCKAEGPEGEFLRKAGIHKHWVTSSGYMNCVSASGKYLGRRASEKVLEEFRKLPETERKPGAVRVPQINPSEELVPSPPPGGLVLKVHARFMTFDKNGALRYAKGPDFPLLQANPKRMKSWELFLHPNTEYMWVKKEEWQSLVPANPKEGQKSKIPAILGERMARFHLTPRRAITSEGGILSKRQIRTANLSLEVKKVTPKKIRFQLTGFIHTGSTYHKSKATTPNGPLGPGYETPVYGILEYNRMKKVFERFDIICPGHVWGRWGDANNNSLPVERPGRTPFVFAFELATGDSPTDRIPPGGNCRYISEQRQYFSASE